MNNCLFFQEGKTALFYAITNDFMCEDDKMKDVLEYLVITKGIDINSVDKVAIIYVAHSLGEKYVLGRKNTLFVRI